MDVIRPFWTIYNLFDRMKNNKEQCPHVHQRLKALEKLVLFITQKELEHLSDDVKEALEKLNVILLSAADLIKRFNDSLKVTQVMKSSDFKLEFDNLNKSLTDAFVTLSAALHAQQRKKEEEQEMRLAEQEKKLVEQERKLAEQEDKLAEHEEILERVEAKLGHESRGYYCVLQ